MTTPSPDEMKARGIASALRVNASTTGADAEEELIVAITQALSEKTEEIERIVAREAETVKLAFDLQARAEAAEARLSEVVEECADMLRLSSDEIRLAVGKMSAETLRAVKAVLMWREDAIRARFQHGGKDNG